MTTPIFTPNTPVCFRDGILFRLNSLLVNFTESFTSTLEREKPSVPCSGLCWTAPGPQRAAEGQQQKGALGRGPGAQAQVGYSGILCPPSQKGIETAKLQEKGASKKENLTYQLIRLLLIKISNRPENIS